MCYSHETTKKDRAIENKQRYLISLAILKGL